MSHHYKKIGLSILLSTLVLCSTAQTDADRAKIAASQAGASSLYYNPNVEAVTTIEPGSFYNEKECNVRGGMPNFFAKLNAAKPVIVGYIGGSITQSNVCYRMQASKYIQLQYPNVDMKWMNAGVSGTGTDLAACRIQEQLLKNKPDLVFIEFAVNGAYQAGMEGIVRQIIKSNPKIDICLIYTVVGGQTKTYAEGGIPDNIQGLETIAAHYNIPSIHLAMEAAQLEKDDKLVWKGDAKAIQDKIIFSADGIHPSMAGGNLYGAAIARSIQKMKNNANASKHVLPKALIANNWEDAKMLSPLDVATFTGDWTNVDTKDHKFLKQFNSWFPYIMQTEKPGSSFTFKFKGTMFGVFDVGGPEVGQLSITLDGKPAMLKYVSNIGYNFYRVDATACNDVLNRFNYFCTHYRGQYDFVYTENGEHTVTIAISNVKANKRKILGSTQLADITAHPEKYDRTVFYLGKILLRGEIIQ